jgi:hypothetical protein
MGRAATATSLILLFALLALPTIAAAHAGHVTISEEAARTRALDAVTLLVDRGKLDDSWREAKVSSSEMVYFEGIEEWHVVVENPAEPDPAKQKLYVFINYDGQLLAANFSGRSD